MKIFLLVLAFAISFLDADAAIEYCCVKKSVRKIFGGKSDCTPHHTETASSAKCAKGNIIVKEFDPDHWKKCCEGLKFDAKGKCLNKGCFAGSHANYEAAETNKVVNVMNPLNGVTDVEEEEDTSTAESTVVEEEEGTNTTVAEEEEEETTTPKKKETTPKKDPNPCVSSDGKYLVMDCIASIKNRQFQDLVEFHFRKFNAGGLKHKATPFTYVAPVNEGDEGDGASGCGGNFPEPVDVQQSHYCGMHAINNALMLRSDDRVTKAEMRTSALNIHAANPFNQLAVLYSPSIGDYSIYVVGDRLSKKSGKTVHQFSTTGTATRGRYLGDSQMMQKLRSKNIVVAKRAVKAKSGHYVALRPIGNGNEWCYIDSLGGGGAGTKITMTATQAKNFLLGSQVSAFLTVDKADGDDASPFDNSQETYNPVDNVVVGDRLDAEREEDGDVEGSRSSLGVSGSSTKSTDVRKSKEEGLSEEGGPPDVDEVDEDPLGAVEGGKR